MNVRRLMGAIFIMLPPRSFLYFTAISAAACSSTLWPKRRGRQHQHPAAPFPFVYRSMLSAHQSAVDSFLRMIFSENRFTLCANAALRVPIMR
jgi:hypothetical protein